LITGDQTSLATSDVEEAQWELLDRATSTRLRLLAADFVPLPVDGKRPATADWQNSNKPSADEIKQWTNVCPSATNTGILCFNTPTIDDFERWRLFRGRSP